jgi:DMSO/TMAO reductase YedYZ molybdopterin-dependent catalytic subunit
VKDGDNMLEENTWTGIRLTDLMNYLGVTDYTVVSVEAADGYSQELEPDRIDEQGTGFAWMKNGELLEEGDGPIQLVNHGRGTKWWIKQVAKITVIK